MQFNVPSFTISDLQAVADSATPVSGLTFVLPLVAAEPIAVVSRADDPSFPAERTLQDRHHRLGGYQPQRQTEDLSDKRRVGDGGPVHNGLKDLMGRIYRIPIIILTTIL